MGLWYDSVKGKNQIVVASRARLARNLSKYPFSLKLDDVQAEQMIADVREKFFQQMNDISEYYSFGDLSRMDKAKVFSLAECYMITPTLAEKKQSTAVILSEDGSESIMLNEDDHIRMQTLFMGDNLDKALTEADRLDDVLSERIEYAYNHKYGYITSCPTAMGTGLRATYILHLPFLEQKNIIKPLAEELNRLGFSLQGLCGHKESYGCIYQLSNQKTLGVSEKEIISSLKAMMRQIYDHERRVREHGISKDHGLIEDKVYKSYGILKYGKMFSTSEALEHLSNLRMGLCEGIITSKSEVPDIWSMMLQVQPYTLMTMRGSRMNVEECNQYRAQYIHENLSHIIVE